MGNYEELKAAVASVIETNGNQEITGAILQNALLSIISTVGSNATFAGIATPDTNPGAPDQNVFWIATENGTYSNFNGEKIFNECAIFVNKTNEWKRVNFDIASMDLIRSLNEQIGILGMNSLFLGSRVSFNTTSGYIGSNGKYIENPNSLLSDYIETDAIKAFLYTGLMNGSNPNVVGYDAEKNFIGTIIVGNSKNRKNYPILLDDSIKYIRVQSNSTLALYNVKNISEIIKNIYSLVNELGTKVTVRGEKFDLGVTGDGFIGSSGIYIENPASILTDYIDTENITNLIYNGSMSGTNPNVVWYDENKNFGGVLLNSVNLLNDTWFAIPSYAKYIRAQSKSTLALYNVKNISEIIKEIESVLFIKGNNTTKHAFFTKQFIDSKGNIVSNPQCNLSDYIDVEVGEHYFATGRMGGTNPIVLGFNALKEPKGILVYADNGQKRIDYQFVIPEDILFVRIQSLDENPILLKGDKINDVVTSNKEQIDELLYYSGEDLLTNVLFTKEWVASNGIAYSNPLCNLSDYIDVEVGEHYFATGRMNGTNPVVVAYDSDKTFLRVLLRVTDGIKLVDEELKIKDDSIKYIRVQSVDAKPQLKKRINIKEKIAEISQNEFLLNYVSPQIYQLPQKKKNISDGVRIMGFGSSFFMNTWWYLPYLLQAAGINAELSFFFTGGASFDQWIDRFENNSSVNCWVSTNGSDFEKTTKNFRDCIEEGWDIIGFQQGAFQSRDWSTFENWSKLVSYIRRSCGYNTFIGFNCLWPPAIQGNLSPYPSTAEGQMLWQLEANDNFKKFISLSGLNSGAVPNGATIWALRKNPLTKDETEDLAYGGLHINNGLPMYATAATWFETIVSPMFDITIDNIDWIPTEETPYCEVSPKYTPINIEQRNLIRKIIKLSASNRFGLNEL
jgi:hypothetical protein